MFPPAVKNLVIHWALNRRKRILSRQRHVPSGKGIGIEDQQHGLKSITA